MGRFRVFGSAAAAMPVLALILAPLAGEAAGVADGWNGNRRFSVGADGTFLMLEPQGRRSGRFVLDPVEGMIRPVCGKHRAAAAAGIVDGGACVPHAVIMDMLLSAGGGDSDLFLGDIAAIIAIILAFSRFVLRRLQNHPVSVVMFPRILLDQAAGASHAMAVFIYHGILQIHPVISAARADYVRWGLHAFTAAFTPVVRGVPIAQSAVRAEGFAFRANRCAARTQLHAVFAAVAGLAKSVLSVAFVAIVAVFTAQGGAVFTDAAVVAKLCAVSADLAAIAAEGGA